MRYKKKKEVRSSYMKHDGPFQRYACGIGLTAASENRSKVDQGRL